MNTTPFVQVSASTKDDTDIMPGENLAQGKVFKFFRTVGKIGGEGT